MDSKAELKILKTAILNEVEGQFFYRLAAEKTESQEVRDAFLILAGEEEKHEKWLREIFAQAAGKDQAGRIHATGLGLLAQIALGHFIARHQPQHTAGLSAPFVDPVAGHVTQLAVGLQ